MILCTVGTHNQPFDRLVIAMDEFAATTDEPVIIQRGSSTYLPRHAEHFQFTTYEHMKQLTLQARVIVLHAAAGSIIVSLSTGTPLVVVPRLKRYGEVLDDHQIELAEALGADGSAIAVRHPSVETLHAAIGALDEQRIIYHKNQHLVDSLKRQLLNWEHN